MYTAKSHQLKIRNLSGNHLTVMEKNSLFVFKNLKKLYLSNNPIDTLYPESFTGLHKSMDHCELKTVDLSLFTHLSELETLDLSHNQITVIIPATLPSIEILRTNDNLSTELPNKGSDSPALKQININDFFSSRSILDTLFIAIALGL